MPASATAVTRTFLPGIALVRSGKVREIYDLGEHLLMVATDRISAFDVVLPSGIPDKGKVLNQLSAFWFGKLASIAPNHMISAEDSEVAQALGPAYDEAQLSGRCMIVEKCLPAPLECVARAYIAGSLYKDYVRAGGLERAAEVHGIGFPQGLLLCERLPATVFTPATKAAEGHDENIDMGRAAALIGEETLGACREATLRLFEAAKMICDSAGVILADTKFEFGRCNGTVKLIDEALTPDSSRFWAKGEYVPGRAQESFDKQFIRDYLETIAWEKTPPGPELPERVIEETRERYIEIFRRITGAEPQL